jgi:hypothetical protein
VTAHGGSDVERLAHMNYREHDVQCDVQECGLTSTHLRMNSERVRHHSI